MSCALTELQLYDLTKFADVARSSLQVTAMHVLDHIFHICNVTYPSF